MTPGEECSGCWGHGITATYLPCPMCMGLGRTSARGPRWQPPPVDREVVPTQPPPPPALLSADRTTAPTVRVPRPDQALVLAAAHRALRAAREHLAAVHAGCTSAEIARAARLIAGTGCHGCGARAVDGTRQCQRCAIAEVERGVT